MGTIFTVTLSVQCGYTYVSSMSLVVRPTRFGKAAHRLCRTVVNQGIERVIDSARSWIELCSQENYTNAIID